jgi:hypothetical protein
MYKTREIQLFPRSNAATEGGGGSSETEKVCNAVKTIQPIQHTTKYFQTQVCIHSCGPGYCTHKYLKSSISGRIQHTLDEGEAEEKQKNKKGSNSGTITKRPQQQYNSCVKVFRRGYCPGE